MHRGRKRTRHPGSVRAMAVLTAAATVVSLLTSTAQTHAMAVAKAPSMPDIPRVAAHPFPLAEAPAAAPMSTGVRDGVNWPAGAEQDVRVGSATSSLPIQFGAVPSPQSSTTTRSGVPDSVHVRMWDHTAAVKAGVTGVVFTLSNAASTPDVKATARVDYSGFANAGGADFGSRLRLVRLPACVLTTPEVAACRTQTPISGSRNDARSRTVSADVAVSGSSTVLAATAGSSGPNGSFTATSLSPSGSWSAGGASGAFTWSYPIALPPAAAGAAPKVALSYSSAAVDGQTATTNNQPSWIGEGWDYSPGFIERTYRPCAAFPDLPAASQTGDNCWAGQILTMSLNGSSNALVWDPGTQQVRLQNDDGSRVEHLTGASNGALGGEYWKVTTTDGMQYFFGRNSGPGYAGQGTTNSTWTAPVFGAHAGDPCFNSAGFASSVCTQAWRWNLDYVEDTHGNVTMYYYTPETGFYGQNNGTTGVAYTRGGYLNRIDYGLRDENGTVYGAKAPDQVVFTVAERCIPGTPTDNTCSDSQFTFANRSYWPDVPVDQNCTPGTSCTVSSPTFWTRKMLSNITTQYWNGSAYVKVDSYDLGHQFPTAGDPALWLSSITRTGYTASGQAVTLPPVTVQGQLLDNRLAGYLNLPPMQHWRVTTLTTDTGEQINVTYRTSCPSENVSGIDPSSNTTQCMPVYWSPPGFAKPIFDWFDKYVVTEVDESDPSLLTPAKKTWYSYVGGAAWHFDDNEVVKPENRTYGQFRGYGEVDVKTGDPARNEPLTKSATFYLRGMNGDTLPGGGTRSVSVTNTLGETGVDDGRFADQPYETQTFDGDGGLELSATFTDYTVVGTTATRPRTGLPALTADLVRTAKSRTRTDLTSQSPSNVRTATTVSTYDGTGRLVSTDASGDGVPELCTTTAYADNTGSWIRNRPSETIESRQPCPAPGTAQSNVLADSRSYYDGSTQLGQLAGAGDVTRADVLNNTNGGAAAFFTKATTAYDASGRVTSVTDALGHTTTTAYTPADGGVLTATAVTNPLNQTATTVVNPDRGTTAAATGIDGHVTSATYDGLGRVTQVWKPGHAQGSTLPNETFSYLVQGHGPLAVTAKSLVEYADAAGTPVTDYVTAVTLSDALGRVVQTQTDTEGGGSKMADTFYDGHGWTVATNNHYLIAAAPSTVVQQPGQPTQPQPVQESQVDDRTVNTFDGSGRVTTATSYKLGVATSSTRTVYGGDRTTVIPPAGGVTTSTITDVRGNTTELDQYTAAPNVTGSIVTGGTFQPTTYTYDALGRRTGITSSGSTWSYTLDMLGNKLSQNDPDTGTSTTRYDLAGQTLSTTDARGQTLAYTYDALGRKTAEYSGSTTGTKLADWTWDTLQPGKLTSADRYTSTGTYTTGVSSYDGMGNPMATYVTLPFSETGLNQTWKTGYTYSSTGLPLTIGPAPVAGTPAETITNTYDALGNPVAVNGASIRASQALNGYGLSGQITYGGSTNNAWLSSDYDVQTLKPTRVTLSTQNGTAQADDTTYTYDPSGQITRITDIQGPAGASPIDDQCFTYDALDRLTAAWTATDACAAAPSNTVGGGNIGGPNPYWTSWTFNPDGDRASQTSHTSHTLPGAPGPDTVTTYSYTSSQTNGGHTLCAQSTSGPAPTSPCTYTYDPAGNTTSRPDPSSGTAQTLTWDPEGHLAKATSATGTTSWVYDADGNQILRHDPGSTTLYLPGQEITRTANGTLTSTRYYTLGGTVIGESTGQAATTDYLVGDQHGTKQIAVNTTTLAVTRRAMDPYGNARGAVSGGAWPDNHGFLDKSVSAATGLTDVGARKYDSGTGRFLSADPVLDASQPQQLAAYTYSDNNPTNLSDPSGLYFNRCPDGECSNGGYPNGNPGVSSDDGWTPPPPPPVRGRGNCPDGAAPCAPAQGSRPAPSDTQQPWWSRATKPGPNIPAPHWPTKEEVVSAGCGAYIKYAFHISNAGGVCVQLIEKAQEAIWEQRGELASIAATGICFIPVTWVLCGVAQTAAFVVRTEQRVDDEGGWGANWRAIVADGALTATSFGAEGIFASLIERAPAGVWASMGRGSNWLVDHIAELRGVPTTADLLIGQGARVSSTLAFDISRAAGICHPDPRTGHC